MSDTYYPNPALGGASDPQPTPTSDPSPQPARRRGFVLPLLLIGGGLFALGVNLGLVDWAVIARLDAFWPLGLVLIGGELLVRGRVSGVTAMVAVIVIVGLLAVAAGQAASSDWLLSPAGPQVTTTTAYPVGQITSPHLRVDGSAVRMTIRSAPLGDDLFRATSTTPRSEAATFALDRAGGSLAIDLGHRRGWLDNGGTRRTLDLLVNDSLPWVVALNGAAVSGDLDLSSTTLSALTIDGGAAHYSIKLPAPVATVPVRVSGAAMSLELLRGAGTEMRVQVTGGANSLTVDGEGHGGIGALEWSSAGYQSSPARYLVTVSGGATSVDVNRSGG